MFVIEHSIQQHAPTVSTLPNGKSMSTKGNKQATENAKLEAKARAVRLQRDLEIQLVFTTDPAEARVIQARIENIKALIRTITNIK